MHQLNPGSESRTSLQRQFIIDRLCTQWEHRELCDFTLCAGTKVFPVHRAYIAASSDYFHAMLTCGMQESLGNHVYLHGVSETGLQAMVEFIYKGTLNISEENMFEVMEAAVHLLLFHAVDLCDQYLCASLTADNCISVINLAHLFSHENRSYMGAAKEYLAVNFHLIVSSGNFLELPYADVIDVFSNPNTVFGTEYKLYLVLRRWLDHDPASRMQHIEPLLNMLRYGLMNQQQVSFIMGEVSTMHKSMNTVRKLLDEDLFYIRQPGHARVALHNKRAIPRTEPVLVALLEQSACHNKTTYQDVQNVPAFLSLHKGKDSNVWIKVPSGIDEAHPIQSSSATVVNGFLILCGGVIGPEGKACSAACRIFDPRTHKWSSLAPMSNPRALFPLVWDEKHLYAIGGAKDMDNSGFLISNNTETVERYCFSTDTWETVPVLPTKLRQHAAAATTIPTTSIFVSGGVMENRIRTDRMRSLDPETGIWSERAPMLREHARHSMFPVTDLGLLLSAYPDIFPYEFGIDSYNTSTDQWTSLRFSGEAIPRDAHVTCSFPFMYFVNGKRDTHINWDPNNVVEDYVVSRVEVDVSHEDNSVRIVNQRRLANFPKCGGNISCFVLRFPLSTT